MLLKFLQISDMPILLASTSISYGVPIDYLSHLTNFVDPNFPNIVFVKCISILMVDIGSRVGPILLGFVAVYARVGGWLVGPLPHPDEDGADDGSSEVE